MNKEYKDYPQEKIDAKLKQVQELSDNQFWPYLMRNAHTNQV